MGSSRIIATRKRQVFVAYVCSECHNPIITIVQIEAEAQKTYTFSQSKAEQIASETAENAIEFEIKRIESCRRRKEPLTNKVKASSMIAPGHFCDSSISGFETHCPYCSSQEPWQTQSKLLSKTLTKEMSELDEINFPVVFKDADKAENWACEYISSRLEEIEKLRQEPSQIEDAKQTAVSSFKKIAIWERELESLPELHEKELLNHQLHECTELNKQIGILDFKRKKEITTKIKDLELKINVLSQTIEEKEAPIKTKIKREQTVRLYNQAIAFGYVKEIATKQLAKSFVYFFKPYTIPKTLLDLSNEATADLVKTVATPDISKVSSENIHSTKDNEIVFCRKCGYKIIPGSVFCSRCGSKIG